MLGGVEEDVVEVAAVDLVEVRDALGDEAIAREEDVDELVVEGLEEVVSGGDAGEVDVDRGAVVVDEEMGFADRDFVGVGLAEGLEGTVELPVVEPEGLGPERGFLLDESESLLLGETEGGVSRRSRRGFRHRSS